MSRKLYAILPCYNEEDNIKTLLNKWLQQKDRLYANGYLLKIVAIDDKSTDSTNEILQAYINGEDITVIEHIENQGLGGAISSGLDYFANNSSEEDAAIIMDADNTHDPIYIFSMLAEIESGADCVIASRYCSASKVIGLDKHRDLLTMCAKIYYESILGIPGVRDYTCGFRAYRSNIIIKAKQIYGGNLVTDKSFACMMELLYKLHIIGAKITEIPFELRYDLKKGKSKMNVLKTTRSSIVTAIKLRLSLKNQTLR